MITGSTSGMGLCGSSEQAPSSGGGGGGGGGDEGASGPLNQAEIQARIKSGKQTLKLEGSGLVLEYAYVSQRGYYPDGTHSRGGG